MNHKGPRVILFLGAGASHFAGYHTFVDFPELLFNTDLRKEEGMPALAPNPERLLKAIRDSLSRNNMATTHDNFLWRLDGYNQFLSLNQRDDVLRDFLRNNSRLYDLSNCTEEAIYQISVSTIHHYSANKVEKAKAINSPIYEKMRKVLSLYRCIEGFNNGNHVGLPIFTTNYDMLLEDLASEFYNQGNCPLTLVNGIPQVKNELSAWNIQEYKNQNINNAFYLHRLHGCVCWFYHEMGDKNVYFHRADATQQQVNKLYAMYPGKETRIGAGPHGYAFRTFYQNLQTCDLVIFIGFSFRDDDVMHVLLKALAERRGKLKILAIDLIYTDEDIVHKLEDASHRTTFPYRIPKKNEIESVNIHFGDDPDFDTQILECCNKLLD